MKNNNKLFIFIGFCFFLFIIYNRLFRSRILFDFSIERPLWRVFFSFFSNHIMSDNAINKFY